MPNFWLLPIQSGKIKGSKFAVLQDFLFSGWQKKNNNQKNVFVLSSNVNSSLKEKILKLRCDFVSYPFLIFFPNLLENRLFIIRQHRKVRRLKRKLETSEMFSIRFQVDNKHPSIWFHDFRGVNYIIIEPFGPRIKWLWFNSMSGWPIMGPMTGDL